jgi:hypothetical protein
MLGTSLQTRTSFNTRNIFTHAPRTSLHIYQEHLYTCTRNIFKHLPGTSLNIYQEHLYTFTRNLLAFHYYGRLFLQFSTLDYIRIMFKNSSTNCHINQVFFNFTHYITTTFDVSNPQICKTDFSSRGRFKNKSLTPGVNLAPMGELWPQRKCSHLRSTQGVNTLYC